MDEMKVTSGIAGRQKFETGARSQSGGNTPLPEGRWGIGPVEWKEKGNWSAHWNGPHSGLGPVWVGLEYEAPGHTARKAIGIHLDANMATSPGSAGCVVLSNKADVEKLIRWLEGGNVKNLYVDWGLKTCPKPRAV
jgi:lysozyme